MSKRKIGVYRDGKVHVLSDKCASCIFRSVNDGRIILQPGRVAGMVQKARSDIAGNIPCHSTIYTEDVQPAICKGFWDLPRRPAALELAVAMDIIVFDPPPPKLH